MAAAAGADSRPASPHTRVSSSACGPPQPTPPEARSPRRSPAPTQPRP